MWFKNLIIYQFTEECTLTAAQLHEVLEADPFKPCDRISPQSQGWIAPIGDGEKAPLAHESNNCLLFCLRSEEKLIPSSVIRERLEEAVADYEEKQGRKPHRKEQENMRDDIYFTLLPQAFTKNTNLYAYIDIKLQRLIINTSSINKAEVLCSLLRQSLGSLKIELLDNSQVKHNMTMWLRDKKQPASFSIRDAAVLTVHNEDKGRVRYQNYDLYADDIQLLLKNKAEVTQLAMTWAGQISFTLCEDFSLKSLRFLDILKEQATDAYTDTAEQQFDTDFTIMASSLRELLQAF